jgi:uncharacterized protein (TIRG00374 family)
MLKSKKFWGIIASFLFLWLALQKVELKQVPEILASLQYRYIFFICISYTLEHITRASRWQLILADRPLSLKHSYFGVVLGYFFNNMLPARAGEFLRAFYIKKKNIAPGSEAFGSVVFERFLDGIVIVSFIVYSMQKFTATPLIRKAGLSAIVFYAIVLVAIVLLQFRRAFFVKFSGFIFSLFPEKLAKPLHNARDSFINGLSLIRKPADFAKAMVMSFFTWGISVFTLWLSLEMFSFNLGPAESMLLISVIAIGSMIPSSPGMIGIYQFCCVVTLNGMLGLSPEKSATFGLVCHTIALLYVMIAGFLILAAEGLSFKELSSQRIRQSASKNDSDIS